VQPEHSDGLLVIPSRHHASNDKRGWPGNRQTFKNATTAMFSTRLTTAIRRAIPRDRPAARSRTPGCSRARSRLAVLAGRITDPLPLLGIYLRPGRVVAGHNQRPSRVRAGLAVLAAGVRVLWHGRAVLAADDLPGLEAGGGQPACLGQVALTWRVIADQQLSQFGR